MATVALGVIMVGIDGSVVAVANPYIGKGFHASLADLQWVTNSYLLVIAVALILGGKLGDRYGRRRMFLIGVVGFALSSLAIGFAPSISMVIGLRAVQGAFGALILPNTLALLKAAFPGDALNRAVGIWVSASAAATASGPIVGGILVEHLSWRSVFFINVPLGALTLVVGIATLTESRESVLERFDIPGVLSLATGLSAVVYGLVKAQSWGWGSDGTWLLVGAGLAMLVVFVVVELRVAHPLVPMEIFRIRAVSASTVIVLLNFFALFGVLFFVSLYLQSVHGFSPVSAGMRLLPLTIAFAISGPVGSRLVERFGAWIPITFGLLATALAFFALASLQVNSSYLHLWPPFLLIGLGIGFVVTAATDSIVGEVSDDEAGVAGGIQTTAIQLGGVLGTAICGSILFTSVASHLLSQLVSHGVPAGVARQLSGKAATVAQGLAPVPAGSSAHLAAAITQGSHAAFMAGLHTTMIVAALVALLGAALGPLVRSSSDSEHVIAGEGGSAAPKPGRHVPA
jgi:EmrB/QacA subfamily drug resistance transporter